MFKWVLLPSGHETQPGELSGIWTWLLISSVKIFTSWDCKFFRWEFHGRFWSDVSCTFEYLQMVGCQINLPKEFFAKLYHLYPSRFSQKKFHQWFDWFKKDTFVASHEPCDIIMWGNFKSPSALVGWTQCFASKIGVANFGRRKKAKKNMGVGGCIWPYSMMGIRNSLLPRCFSFWIPVCAWGMVVGYHCGISNDFSTALGREAQGSTVSPSAFFGSWRFVVGASQLKHDFDEAIKGFFCGKMALYKAFSRWIFFSYIATLLFSKLMPQCAWWKCPFKEV